MVVEGVKLVLGMIMLCEGGFDEFGYECFIGVVV